MVEDHLKGPVCEPTGLLCWSVLLAVGPLSFSTVTALVLPLCPWSESQGVREWLEFGNPTLNNAVTPSWFPRPKRDWNLLDL